MGARPRGRPDGEFVHRQEGPRQRNDRGPQRVGERREQPHRRADGPRDVHGVPVAQLRQVHDRQPQRPRERADRPPAGLLQEALSARQRRPARGRPLRRTAGARSGGAVLRRDPEAGARPGEALHSGADAGRRAQRHGAARRRRPVGDLRLPRAGGLGPGVRGHRPRHAGSRRHALGPAPQGAGRDQARQPDLRRQLPVPRPRPGLLRRAGPHRRVAGKRPRRADPGGRVDCRHSADRGGDRARPHDAPHPDRAGTQLRRARRPADQRVDRHGRLAPALPAPRPAARGHRGRRPQGGGQVLQAVEPDDGPLHPDLAARSRRDCAATRRGVDAEGLQGQRGGGRGRGVRPVGGERRVSNQPCRHAGQPQAVAPAQEDARGDGGGQPDPAIRRRDIAQGACAPPREWPAGC